MRPVHYLTRSMLWQIWLSCCINAEVLLAIWESNLLALTLSQKRILCLPHLSLFGTLNSLLSPSSHFGQNWGCGLRSLTLTICMRLHVAVRRANRSIGRCGARASPVDTVAVAYYSFTIACHWCCTTNWQAPSLHSPQMFAPPSSRHCANLC